MTTSGVSGSSTSSKVANSKSQLKSEDFINLMVTELQNQDPLNPTSNSELLSQMSQISQLQSNTTMQSSLKSLVLQNQIGSAGNLIGKAVKGTDSNNDTVIGVVNSVSVVDGTVQLNLDSGKSLAIDRVTAIANMPQTSGATKSS